MLHQYKKYIHIILATMLIAKSDFAISAFSDHSSTSKVSVPSLDTVTFENVENNVPYAKVASLPWLAPSETMLYGDGNSAEQFIKIWRASDARSKSSSKTNTHKSVDVTTKSSVAKNAAITTNHVVVFIHGGCWLQQFSIEHSFALTTAFSQQGFDTYSIEYRRTGSGGEWPVAIQDIKQAFAQIKKQLQKGTTISIIGHSAGGHLASLLAAEQKDENYPVHLFGLAAIIDLAAYSEGSNSCQIATPRFMNGTKLEQATAYKKANPLNSRVEHLSSATFLIGDADKIVPREMAFHPQGSKVIVEGAGHFDWIHPGSNSFKQLIAELKKRSVNE